MPGKELGGKKRRDQSPGDGLTNAGIPREERKARRAERMGLDEIDPLEEGLDEPMPFDGQSAWSAALHDGMAQGMGMRDIMAQHNPGLFGPYVRQEPAAAAPAPAADPLGLAGGAMGALPPELAGMAAASPAGMPAFGAQPQAAPTATVNNFPQQTPQGGVGTMVPPSGGLMGMQQRRPGLPQGFAPNPAAGGFAPASRFAGRRGV